MIADGGPWMGVLGGVFKDKNIAPRLTDLMWVGHSSTEEEARVLRFARMLNALGTCLFQRRSYYDDTGAAKNLSVAPSPSHTRFYSYPTSFTDENNQVIHFECDITPKAHAFCVTSKATTFQDDTIVKLYSGTTLTSTSSSLQKVTLLNFGSVLCRSL